jgi:hypothetical protein
MELALPEVAADLGDVSRRAISEAGGLDLARRAVDHPALRSEEAQPIVEQLGIDELDVRSNLEALMAGAEVCRGAGALAFPFPLPALLARPMGGTARFVAAADEGGTWADHADLAGPWVAVSTDGRARQAAHDPRPRQRTLGPFVEHLSLGGDAPEVGTEEFVLFCVLDCWRILGALEAASQLSVAHVRDRRQFGRALAEFQGVQFHVADADVAVRGLRQLAKYTACRVADVGSLALVDALALRTFALEAANTVLSTSHLLHGAVGFCDEHDLSVITTSIQSSLRLPSDLGRTQELLTSEIDRQGFTGLFDRGEPMETRRTT